MNLPNQKTYSQTLDEDFGRPAEKAVIKFLENRSDIERVERFPFGIKDVDIKVIQSSEITYFIDVERRTDWFWPQWTFPFVTVHIPYRKASMIHTRQPFVYFIVRKDCGRLATLPGSVIVASEVRRSNNKYDRAKFYDVPVENLRYWGLED